MKGSPRITRITRMRSAPQDASGMPIKHTDHVEGKLRSDLGSVVCFRNCTGQLHSTRAGFFVRVIRIPAHFPEAEIIKIDASRNESQVFEQIRKAIDAHLKKP